MLPSSLWSSGCCQGRCRGRPPWDRGRRSLLRWRKAAVGEEETQLLEPEETMTQSGQTSRHFLLTSRQNVRTSPGDDVHNRSAAIPNIAEQMEINISTATQIGHQLAIIGDEYNRSYSGKLEDLLFDLAKGIAASAFQTCAWSSLKSILKSFGSFFNTDWRRKMFDYGHWVNVFDFAFSMFPAKEWDRCLGPGS
ncbi:hypothetical protein lerEdw1_000653 [Lerista edwardsae]|nr:hypothetical protein lerEdw1_000653 [Lerista edwardsae]